MTNANFGWIDFSNEHRDRVYAVMDLLSKNGSVDELGVGIVRDAIADWLFPGISTIQTRAKYFIIIPQIFRTYLQKYQNKEKVPSLKEFLRSEENRIMHQLASNYAKEEKKGEGHGIIGINVARNNGELARKPSSVYWNGLRTHKIIASHLSLSEYLHGNDLSKAKSGSHLSDESEHDMAYWNDNFAIKSSELPEVDENTRMDLTHAEADLLRTALICTNNTHKHEGNLLTQILKSDARIITMQQSKDFCEMTRVFLKDINLPQMTRDTLRVALYFDLLIHGAHIRYNILLHQKAGNQVKSFLEDWENWITDRDENIEELKQLDFSTIFSVLAPRTPVATQIFMQKWQDEALKDEPNLEVLDGLVKKQEINKKGAKAKLAKKSGEYSEWVGLRRLQYRFYQAKTIISDIHNGYDKS